MRATPAVNRLILVVLAVAALLAVLPSVLGERSLLVVTVGDSVTYDADPGIRAALELAGSVVVDTRSIGGVGVLRPGIDGYLDEAMTGDPDVVVVTVSYTHLTLPTIYSV